MAKRPLTRSAAAFIPPTPTLPHLRQAAKTCTGCDLYQRATQTVFGEGASHAKLIFVGEQPGDQEDLQGHPFVGPAGRLLDKALVEAGIPRNEVYITNAVKHFKWEPQGKRRKHKRPSAGEVAACRPWLASEVNAIHPRILVCLGATAALSVLGKVLRINEARGQFMNTPWAAATYVTIHPSSIFRHRERVQQEAEYRHFVEDLKHIRRKLMEYERSAEPSDVS